MALQHAAVAADQQNICRLVQVCKAWRKAVKQSRACLTNVRFSRELLSDAEKPLAAAAGITAELGRCAHWLSAYAGTVRSIDLEIKGFEAHDDDDDDDDMMQSAACGIYHTMLLPWACKQ